MNTATLPIPAIPAERAAKNYTVAADGCWVSNYAKMRSGYAVVTYRDPETKRDIAYTAHRASWTFYRGAIAAGMTVDHMCYNRACINPDHLRVLSLRDNSRRHSGHDWPLGTCPNGHPDSDQVEVTWARKARWTCGPCMKARNDRQNAKRKALRARGSST